MRQMLRGVVLECTDSRFYDPENDLALGDLFDPDFAFLTWRAGHDVTLPKGSTPIGVLIGNDKKCQVACTGAGLFSQTILAYFDEVIEIAKTGVRYRHSENYRLHVEPHTVADLELALDGLVHEGLDEDVDPTLVSSENVLQVAGHRLHELVANGPCWLEIRPKDGADDMAPWPGKQYGIAEQYPDPIEAEKAADRLVALGLATTEEIYLLINGKQDRSQMFPSTTTADGAAA